MLGRLALGLLGGLGKGMMAAGGGKVALELAKMALGGRGKGSGSRGDRAGGGGRGGQEGRRQQDVPLEDILRALGGEQKVRGVGISSGRELPSEFAARALGMEDESSAVMTDIDEAALRCLAAHIVSFTEGRVRLRHPVLRAAPLPEELRRELLEHTGLREATFNGRTGSILLLYDAGQLDRPGLLAALLPLGRYLVQASALADETA